MNGGGWWGYRFLSLSWFRRPSSDVLNQSTTWGPGGAQVNTPLLHSSPQACASLNAGTQPATAFSTNYNKLHLQRSRILSMSCIKQRNHYWVNFDSSERKFHFRSFVPLFLLPNRPNKSFVYLFCPPLTFVLNLPSSKTSIKRCNCLQPARSPYWLPLTVNAKLG